MKCTATAPAIRMAMSNSMLPMYCSMSDKMDTSS
jgi:hypothetical protein